MIERVWRFGLRRRIKPLVYRLRSDWLYRACSFYINVLDNDHDSDLDTNGEAAFARARLPGAALAFDVGAAKGLWTEIALAADPSLVVHCFEPTARRYQMLVDRNFGPRAVLNKLAVGDSSGTHEVFSHVSGGSNSLFPQRYSRDAHDPVDVEVVDVTSLDRYCAERGIERVDFIKMDIEGYEAAAIRGAEGMLRAGKIGILQFEYSCAFLDAGASLMSLMKYVKDVNPDYEFYKLYPDGVRHVETYEHRIDTFKTQNWAIIHERA